MEGTGEVVRIRLMFEDQNMLNRRQRLEGLKQCWMIVKPHLKTVEEIATDISLTFQLHRRCPHGLVLSMEGFTLPSSQLTCILKDKDIVSVNKKSNASEKEILTNEEASIKGFETLGERLPGHGGVKLLAIDEFEKEAGGYQSEYEDDGTNSIDDDICKMELPNLNQFSKKKRTQSKLAWSSNGRISKKGKLACVLGGSQDNKDNWGPGYKIFKKRRNIAVPDNHGNSLQVVEEFGYDEHIRKKHKKIRHTKEIPCDAVEDQNHTRAHEVDVKGAEDVGGLQFQEEKSWKKEKKKKTKHAKETKESDEFQQTDHTLERCLQRDNDQVEMIIPETENASLLNQGEKKSPSRSAKRKKAKRRWLREQKAKNQELVLSNGIFDKQILRKSGNLQKSNQDDDVEAEEETLPVVVKPGHIRFLTVDEEYESQEIQDSVPAHHWNGITSKRQGQNWGKQKNSVNRVKEPGCPREAENFSSHNREEEPLNKCPLNFDELPSMSGFPQEGDIIAYRMVELSTTSWCPELSSFRVGKIASYDCQSTKIRLVPVSEYPVMFKDSIGEENAEEIDISPYNKDGSLEIDFGSLVDVRRVHQQNSNTNTSSTVPVVMEADTVATCANVETNSKSSADIDMGFPVAEQPTTATNANGDGENMNVWDEINQAFSSKKSELALKEDQVKTARVDTKTRSSKKSKSKSKSENAHISKEGTETPTPRYFKALKSGALGPTVSFLRAQNIL